MLLDLKQSFYAGTHTAYFELIAEPNVIKGSARLDVLRFSTAAAAARLDAVRARNMSYVHVRTRPTREIRSIPPRWAVIE